MASVHGLQQVIAAFVADFAHDDAVGTVPESCGDKLAWSHGNLIVEQEATMPTSVGPKKMAMSSCAEEKVTPATRIAGQTSIMRRKPA